VLRRYRYYRDILERSRLYELLYLLIVLFCILLAYKVNLVLYYYEVFYSGNRQIGIATSTDLVNWTKYPGNPIFKTGVSEPDANGQFNSDVFTYDGYYYILIPHSDSLNIGGTSITLEAWIKAKSFPSKPKD